MCDWSGDWIHQQEGNIFVKRRYLLIRIYLSQFCFKGVGDILFYFVISFVNRCALHSKLNFHSLVYEMFRKQIEFWLNCVEIYVHSPYYQFKLHHQSDCTCLLNKYGFFYWYMTGLIIWNLIFWIYIKDL